MTWLNEAAALLSSGTHEPCAAGHEDHTTRVVRIDGSHDLPDWPQLRLAPFDLRVFDAPAYRDTAGYCPADSDVSLSIITHGAWEMFETVLAMRILWSSGDGAVVDFGANIGWYSVLALKTGRPVVAVEADHVIAEVCEANLAAAVRCPPVGQQAYVVARGWVDADTPMLPNGPRIRLVKVDLEGGETAALNVLTPALSDGLVDFLLVELTPAFGAGAQEVVDRLDFFGYRGFTLPDKGYDVARFETDPLGCTLAAPLGTLGPDQVNALFVAPHLR